ncbi:type 1 glutamine amidotransferase [Burkholderia sp. MR1-5-21]
MKVLVIQHESSCPVGALGTFLKHVCHSQIHTVDANELDGTIAPDAYDLYVVLGSSLSTNDLASAWIPREINFLRRLMAASRPVIGICFGAQAIAQAAGGSVGRMDHCRYGWIVNEVASSEVWCGPWFNWHSDAINLPEHAELLATSQGTVQAFQIGCAVGVQFHPEVTPEIVRTWPEPDGYSFAAGFHDETLEFRTGLLFAELLWRANKKRK